MPPLLQFCEKNPQFSWNIFAVFAIFAVNFFAAKQQKLFFCAKQQTNLLAHLTVLKNYFTHKRANSFTILVAIIKIFSPADAGIVLKMVSNIMQGAPKKGPLFNHFGLNIQIFLCQLTPALRLRCFQLLCSKPPQKWAIFSHFCLQLNFCCHSSPPPDILGWGPPSDPPYQKKIRPPPDARKKLDPPLPPPTLHTYDRVQISKRTYKGETKRFLFKWYTVFSRD